MTFYLLDVDTPVETDLETWAATMASGGNQLWSKRLRKGKKVVTVSTIFLGHPHLELFETAIFDLTPNSPEIYRASTYAEAERMHRECVAKVVEAL